MRYSGDHFIYWYLQGDVRTVFGPSEAGQGRDGWKDVQQLHHVPHNSIIYEGQFQKVRFIKLLQAKRDGNPELLLFFFKGTFISSQLHHLYLKQKTILRQNIKVHPWKLFSAALHESKTSLKSSWKNSKYFKQASEARGEFYIFPLWFLMSLNINNVLKLSWIDLVFDPHTGSWALIHLRCL